MPPWEIRWAIDLALNLWAIEGLRLPLTCIAVGVLLSIVWAPRRQQRVTDKVSRDRAKSDIRRRTNTRLLRRLWWRFRPPRDTMSVDGLVLDRTGDRSHCLWIGPTGRGKSQSVATVRCNGARPWLAVMPDLSMPLRAKADFIWTAGESTEPIDFLNGTPDDVAHFLTEVFRSGGEGVWKRAAMMATKQIVQDIDAAGELRSLALIGEKLEEMCKRDPALRRMCEGWVTRFLGAAEAMGDSAGPGGIDIADYLNAGLNVVIDNNAWKRPGLKGDVVAFGLAEAKRVADLVPGGFRLIFEEADQLGERIDLADPFFTAGRLREIAVDALVHSEHKLPDAMQTNSATRVYFRPNKPEHRKKVAEALDLTEGEIDRIPDYHAWVEHDGKIRRLIHFPRPAKSSPRSHSYHPTPIQEERPTRRRIVIEELPRYVPLDLPSLPPPSALDAEVESRIDRTGHCHLWTGSKDKDGYGIFRVGKRQYRAHRYVWEQANGPLGSLDIDHQCRTRLCVRLDHLEPVTRRVNVQRMHRTRGHATAAD